MAVVTVTEGERVIDGAGDVAAFLARYGIWYRRFEGLDRLAEDATDEQILAAFDEPIQELMRSGDFQTADVIDVKPTTPGIDAMLAKFSSEHWHSEDEIRFIVEGRGIFHVNPKNGEPVFRIQVGRGDMISVPEGTWHWFDLCDDKRIRAIRLFQDRSGWTPHYTGSGAEARHEPVCMGPAFIPPPPRES